LLGARMPLVGRSPSMRGRSAARSLGLGVRASRAWPCGRSSPVAPRRPLGEGTGSLFGRISFAAAGRAAASIATSNKRLIVASGRESRLVAFLRSGRRFGAAAHIGIGLVRRRRAVRLPRHVVRAGAGRAGVGPGAGGLVRLAALLVLLGLALLRRLLRVARRLAARRAAVLRLGGGAGAGAGGAGFGLDARVRAGAAIRGLRAGLGGGELAERDGQQAGEEYGQESTHGMSPE